MTLTIDSICRALPHAQCTHALWVLALLTAPADVAVAQLRSSGFTIAADVHTDVAYMTNHTTAHGVNQGVKIDRYSAGGGYARRLGLGVEIEYEGSRRTAWLATLGMTSGRYLYRQSPGFRFTPPNIHSIERFTTQGATVGRRRYFRGRYSAARAFYDVQAGYEQLSANLLYAGHPTDSLVKTGGPMARFRAGSQFRIHEKVVADFSLQLHYASYRGWKRSGHPVAGDPTRAFTWTVTPALRMRF